MLLPLKAIISKKVRKDGNSIIYFQYCYSSTNRILLSTEIVIPSLYWNKKRQCISKSLPIESGNADELNNQLSKTRKIIEALIEKGKQENVQHMDMGIYVKERFGLFAAMTNLSILCGL